MPSPAAGLDPRYYNLPTVGIQKLYGKGIDFMGLSDQKEQNFALEAQRRRRRRFLYKTAPPARLPVGMADNEKPKEN